VSFLLCSTALSLGKLSISLCNHCKKIAARPEKHKITRLKIDQTYSEHNISRPSKPLPFSHFFDLYQQIPRLFSSAKYNLGKLALDQFFNRELGVFWG